MDEQQGEIAAEEVDAVVAAFEARGARGLILDMRGKGAVTSNKRLR